MSDVAAPSATESAGIKRYTYAGAALVTLAFAGPDLAAMFGLDNAHSVGLDFSGTLGSLAFFALIAWMVTRNRSSLAQAKARAVVGVMLCLTFIGSISSAIREEFLVKQFMRDTLSLPSRYDFSDLFVRFEPLRYALYLSPDALTSPQRLLAGQAALERYRSFLAERNLLLQAYVAESTALVTALPAGEIRRRAESSFPFRLSVQPEIEFNKRFITTQRSYADALGAVFTWAQANAGRVSVSGETMTFQTQRLQTELTTLTTRLQEAESAVRAVEEKAWAERSRFLQGTASKA